MAYTAAATTILNTKTQAIEWKLYLRQPNEHADIAAINTTNETVSIAGDFTKTFIPDAVFTINGHPTHDGSWTVVSSVFTGGNTVITVSGNFTDNTVQGIVIFPWTQYTFSNRLIHLKEDLPATASFTIPNPGLTLSDEYRDSADTRTYLRAHVQARATIGGETEVRFDGYINSIKPIDRNFKIECVDWSNPENNCLVNLVPDETPIVTEFATPVEITQISSTLGASYGFVLATTPAAFSSGSDRRSWKRTAILLFADASTNNPYPQENYYSVDYSSGAIKILDRDHLSKNYFAQNVYGLKNSTDGTNVDVMRLVQQAYQTAQPMTARVAGAGGTVTIAGDHSADYTVGKQFEIEHSDSNNHDGLYTVASSAFGAGVTVITVDGGDTINGAAASGNLVHEKDYESPRFTAAQLDLTDTGIDIDREYYFKGAVSDLLGKIREDLGVHIKVRWDHDNQKLKGGLAAQKALGAVDWALVSPKRIDVSHNDRDIYTMIVARGQKSLPLNEITGSVLSGGSQDLFDRTTGSADWFAWNGIDVGADSTFAVVGKLLFDADINTAAGVHNLAALETNTPGSNYSGGTSKYSEWYNYIEKDFGEVREAQRMRVVLPLSRNPNANVGAGTILSPVSKAVSFWPGVRILGSVDGSNYFIMTPLMSGRYKPGSTIDVEGRDILIPRVRYIYVLCAAYKHGDENQADPGIGLGLFEVYTDINYEVRAYVSGHDTGHVLTYTDGSTTAMYGPDMMERFDFTHKPRYLDLQNQVDEFLAGDVANRYLEEAVRLFLAVGFKSVSDPRIDLYDTVSVTDEMNTDGSAFPMLVLGIKHKMDGTEVYGVDFNADSLEDSL